MERNFRTSGNARQYNRYQRASHKLPRYSFCQERCSLHSKSKQPKILRFSFHLWSQQFGCSLRGLPWLWARWLARPSLRPLPSTKRQGRHLSSKPSSLSLEEEVSRHFNFSSRSSSTHVHRLFLGRCLWHILRGMQYSLKRSSILPERCGPW